MLNSRGYVEAGKLMPVARLGDISYARIAEAYRIRWKFYNDNAAELEEALKKTTGDQTAANGVNGHTKTADEEPEVVNGDVNGE